MPVRKSNRFTENYKICRALENGEFESEQVTSTDINDIIEGDKAYGSFSPANGEYFTYKVLNDDEEITNKQVLKAIQYSYLRITRRVNLKFRRARAGEVVDLRIEFRTVNSDPDKKLTEGTLMYHYYPIYSLSNRFRGLCVINKKFIWTNNGEGIPLHKLYPEQYPDPTVSTAKTYDIDKVYTHEVCHGLGLPHSKVANNIMSWNYGIMAEWLSEEDYMRLQAKYPKKEMSKRRLSRWIKWLLHASNR